jgi:dihydroflavonol-4-reductase
VSAPALVTGATGFVGAHVARALLERGERVRCLVRPKSDRRNLDGLEVELAEGDLRDPPSLERAVAGCDRLFHVAADYRLYARNPAELYAANVDGTRNLLDAARRAGVGRVVFTSSVGALGLVAGGSATEETPVSFERMVGHYKRSKFLAERVALESVGAGLPVVIVNPSTPIGELDRRPTPTGQIIVDYLNRRIPATVDTGLNLIDVRDVAQGHLLAAEHGKIGARYILGNRNLTLEQILGLLAEISGGPAVRRRLPHAIPIAFAACATAWAKVSGGEPRVSLESARMARHRMFFDAEKAVRELGLPQSPIEGALERAVRFFVDHGYVRSPEGQALRQRG